ncbi:MAG: MucB/RseB C-terminal domain-containing protein [Lysobacterales bacterium]
MKKRRLKFASVGTPARLLALVLMVPVVTAAQTVDEWLDRMASAVSNLTYRGTLVYIRADQVDSMRIYHRVDQSGMRERLVSLNGSPREVLRDNDSVRCIFPDSQSVVVDTRIAERLFPTIPSNLSELSADSYRFSLDGEDRVAQLEAQVIRIAATDKYRYGYRLWLEKNTGMLLKTSLIDARGRAIEQMLFTDIDIAAVIPDRELLPDVSSDGYVEVTLPGLKAIPASVGKGTWGVKQLPAGFRAVANRQADTLNHLLFSDGLATISVYVEPVGDRAGHPSGYSQIGAMNIYGATTGAGYAVTAVGEVPRNTLKMIVSSVVNRRLAAERPAQ